MAYGLFISNSQLTLTACSYNRTRYFAIYDESITYYVDITERGDMSSSAIRDNQLITAKNGQQHTWKSVKLLLATLIVSTLGDGFCGVMMAVALPDIADAYHIAIATANWVTVGYSIVAATAVMMAATLMQRIGLKKLFLISRIFLIVSCVIGLCSVNFPMMLGSRLIQAVGSGLMFPTINSVILELVPPQRSGQVISLNSSIIGLGIAIAPIISGLFLTYVSLTSMYVIPLIIGIISLIMGHKFMFNVEPRANRLIDIPSVILSFVGLFALMYGFSEMTHQPKVAFPLLIVGILILGWFTARQLHLTTPLLDVKPLKYPNFSIGVLMYMAGAIGQQAVLLLMPLYMERACGFTPFVTGVFALGMTICYSGAIIVSGKIVDKRGMWPIVSIGYLVMVIGLLGTCFFAPTKNEWLIVIFGSIVVVGDAFINVPDKDVVMEAVPNQLLPHASSIFSTSAQIASSLGSALFVGVLSADVLRKMHDGVNESNAYAGGFQHSILIALVFEIVMLIVSVWYSLQMVRHGKATITPSDSHAVPHQMRVSDSQLNK